jgi:nucleotide-binding universal stress UspA family protein
MIAEVEYGRQVTAPLVRSVLVDIDAYARAQPALRRAIRIARRCGASLTIVDVLPRSASTRGAAERESGVRREARLRRLADEVRGVQVTSAILSGPAARALVHQVIRGGHDLLIRARARDVAARGARIGTWVAPELLRTCPCPVWILGAAERRQRRFVAAVRASDHPGERALDVRIASLGAHLANGEGGSLTLLHGWTPFGAESIVAHTNREEFSAYLDAERRRAVVRLRGLSDLCGEPAPAQAELRAGPPDIVIPAYALAEGADTVVIGSAHRRGISRILRRETAERLLGSLSCSVLVVGPARSPRASRV